MGIRSASPPLLLLAFLALPSGPITAQEEVHAFVGAYLLPIAGPEIGDGVLLVRGARIEAVGPRSEVEIPANAQVHDLSGRPVDRAYAEGGPYANRSYPEGHR